MTKQPVTQAPQWKRLVGELGSSWEWWALVLGVLGLFVVAAAGCAPADGTLTPGEEPRLALDGKADGGGPDRADRGCRVVLRTVARATDASGMWTVDNGSWVWEGRLDVDAQLVAAGGQPAVLYRPKAGASPYEVAASATGEPAGVGRVRYAVRVVGRDTAPQPGWTASATEHTYAELIPFVRFPDGSRLFDHNRRPGALDSYALANGNDFAVADDASTCPVEGGRATLTFTGDFRTVQTGALVPGGELTVAYDLARLPACRYSRAGYQLWDTVAFVRFVDADGIATSPVPALSVTQVSTPAGGPATREAVPVTVRVPTDAREAQLWFRNFSGADSSCEAWDSAYGANYRVPVVAPPAPVGWAGNWGGSWSRACTHADGIAEPLVVDEYVRERACTFVDADVWVPGVTDGAEPHPEWVWAEAEVTPNGGAPRTEPLAVVGRVGNNLRLRWELPYEARQPRYPGLSFTFRFSTDGRTWYRIGQGDGPDGGAPRTVVVQ